MNFLNPRPGTPFGELPVMATPDELAMPVKALSHVL